MKHFGKVKWFNDEKGYGFIVDHDSNKDVFAHFSQILGKDTRKQLLEGDEVSFDVTTTDKGKQASNIERVTK